MVRRRHRVETLGGIYNLSVFWRYAIQMNSMMCYVTPIMEMKVVRGDWTYFLNVYGNDPFIIPDKVSMYLFLWSNDRPSLSS